MTAKSLPNLPLRNMLRVLRQNRKMAIVTSILMVISGPLIVTPLIVEVIRDSAVSESRVYLPSLEMYAGIGAFCLAVAVFMGMFCAICSFTETHKKSQVDMLYALPLTGNQRFFTDFLGGACMYILPYIITVILGWIIIGVGSLFVTPDASKAFFETDLGEMIRYYAMGTTGLFVLMLLYYSLSTLITICCGTLFECIYANILLNGLIPGTIAAVLGMISSHVDLSFEYLWHIIGFMSPIGGLCYLIYLMDNDFGFSDYCSWTYLRGAETHNHDMLPNYFRWLFIILVLAAVCLIAAWQLYRRRKAEHVGKPFVYIAAYYVMLTLLTVLILCLLDFNVIGPVLLFAAIVYFVCEVIRKRGFKRFWLSILTFIGTVVVTVGVFFVVIKTDCFGRENYVPIAATISSVEVNYSASCSEDFEFTDREVISKITDFHKSIVERKKTSPSPATAINKELTNKFKYEIRYNGYDYAENPYELDPVSTDRYYDDYEDYSMFGKKGSKENPNEYGHYAETFSCDLTYYTLAGTVIHRDMYLSADELAELRSILHDSDLYASTCGTALAKLIAEDVGIHESNDIRVPDVFRLTIHKTFGKQTRAVSGGSASIAQLAAAYERDIRSMTSEQRRTAAIYCSFGEEYDNNSAFKVYEGYNETIALLESWGFRELTVPERYDFLDGDNPTSAQATNQSVLSIRIYAPDQWSTDSLKYPNSSVSYSSNTFVNADIDGKNPAYQDHLILFDGLKTEDYYPEIIALLDAAQDEYISEEPCYCIIVNGERYIIPPKHNDLVQAVIDKGDLYGSEAVETYINEHAAEIWPQYYTNDDQYTDEYNEEYNEEETDMNANVSAGDAEELPSEETTETVSEAIEPETVADGENPNTTAGGVINSSGSIAAPAA
ncbi:MAG: ABC transporter permease [Oscillospiraceae bacterium]|nr:ABC transporter permease [Oscillospiraceae bacterium]